MPLDLIAAPTVRKQAKKGALLPPIPGLLPEQAFLQPASQKGVSIPPSPSSLAIPSQPAAPPQVEVAPPQSTVTQSQPNAAQSPPDAAQSQPDATPFQAEPSAAMENAPSEPHASSLATAEATAEAPAEFGGWVTYYTDDNVPYFFHDASGATRQDVVARTQHFLRCHPTLTLATIR